MAVLLYLILALLASQSRGKLLCGRESTMRAVLGSTVRPTAFQQRCPAPVARSLISKPVVRRLVCMAEQSKTEAQLDKSTADDVWKKLLSAEQVCEDLDSCYRLCNCTDAS